LSLPACAVGQSGTAGELGVEGAPARDAQELVGAAVAVATAPSLSASELLGRATDHSVMLKATFDQSVNAYVEYGSSSGSYSQQTSTAAFSDGMVQIVVSGLATDSLYYYRLRYRNGTTGAFSAGTEHTFRTQRSRASTFTFDVQSDSHQGFQAFYSPALYGVTMQNIANDHPDLFFDLGDTVSTDDATETTTTVNQKYSAQRTFFDMVAHSTPVYLVLGNHENEEGWNLDDFGSNVQNSLPVLGANGRKRYFANPVPDAFYSGNSDQLAQIDDDHLRGDYYAFEWGNALFVALDPFWYTTVKPYAGALGGEKDDEVVGTRWDWTLGKTQYDWLDHTLANSSAEFKFVFAHHPTGGSADYVRAGALGAKYCEWGGYDTDGTTYSFGTHRPGWAMPVHNLLSERGVTAFFHGHDHIFAKEELDGIVYQECPHAANPDYGSGFATNATDYAGAVMVNNSGHLRVTVSPTLVTVDYVRAYLPGDGPNDSVAYTYTISPCKALGSDGKACDDGNPCTTGDHCGSGICQPGTAASCDDGNACTDDTCNPASGCAHANNTAPCSDGNACTSGDRCGGGSCQPGTALSCDDGNGCTDDTCNPASGCTHANNTAPCSDGNVCTTADHCAGGSCQPGTALSCDDGNACTDDACDPVSGCAHTNNTAPCSDDNACSSGDTCRDGACHGTPVACAPHEACHLAGVCDPGSGCSNPVAPDGTACPGAGTCSAGVCSSMQGAGAAGGASGAGGEAGAAGEGGVTVVAASGGTSHAHGGSRSTGGSRGHATGGTSGRAQGGTSEAGEGGTQEPSEGGRETGGGLAAGTGPASGGRASGGDTAAGRGGTSGAAPSSGSGGAQHAPGEHGGCACRVAERRDTGAGAWVAALGLALGLTRRRRARGASRD
jgi:hypothetical protein